MTTQQLKLAPNRLFTNSWPSSIFLQLIARWAFRTPAQPHSGPQNVWADELSRNDLQRIAHSPSCVLTSSNGFSRAPCHSARALMSMASGVSTSTVSATTTKRCRTGRALAVAMYALKPLPRHLSTTCTEEREAAPPGSRRRAQPGRVAMSAEGGRPFCQPCAPCSSPAVHCTDT